MVHGAPKAVPACLRQFLIACLCFSAVFGGFTRLPESAKNCLRAPTVVYSHARLRNSADKRLRTV
eukprot:4696043-Alexandrium_andersonii.AAC.1